VYGRFGYSGLKEAAFVCGGRYGISIDFGLEVVGRKSTCEATANLEVISFSMMPGSRHQLDMHRSRARQAAQDAGVLNATFERGDAEHLPLDDACIDVALVNGIFNLNPARESISVSWHGY